METTTEQAISLFVAGELAGTSLKLNIDALEAFLENPPADFRYSERYAETCRAAIVFARAVRGKH